LNEAQERYQDMLPDIEKQHFGRHKIRYKSPMGRATASHKTNQMIPASESRRRTAKKREELRHNIMTAFWTREKLTTEEIQALLPRAYSLDAVHAALAALHIDVQRVDFVRTPGIRGRGIGVYTLVSHKA
jgi:hypothetical protein